MCHVSSGFFLTQARADPQDTACSKGPSDFAWGQATGFKIQGGAGDTDLAGPVLLISVYMGEAVGLWALVTLRCCKFTHFLDVSAERSRAR